MRKQSIFCTLIAWMLIPLSAIAQKNGQVEWNNEQVSGVNKEEACQIAIPFADERQAATSAMEESVLPT